MGAGCHCGALAFYKCNKVRGQQFVLKNGDTVVFYGDSITAQRLYTKDAEEFLLTRYPRLHIRFVNAGVPGDSMKGGYAGTAAERVQRDVSPFHPAMITVMLGMNDGGWGFGPPDVDATFQTGYRTLLDALRKAAPNARLTLICPTTYDEITHGTEFPGYSHVIDKFAEDVSQIGSQMQAAGGEGVLVADFNRPLTEALLSAKAQFPELAPLIIPDRIHPTETGHWIMAAALMSAWNVDPVVSSLSLDASKAQVVGKQRTTVMNLGKLADGVEWTQLDEALPLPLDFNNAMTPMLLKISKLAELDQMILRVSRSLRAIMSYPSTARRLHASQMTNCEAVSTWHSQRRRWSNRRATSIAGGATHGAGSGAIYPRHQDQQTPISSVTKDQLKRAQDELAAAIRKDLDPKPHEFELRHK